jgi:hypothetical protein
MWYRLDVVVVVEVWMLMQVPTFGGLRFNVWCVGATVSGMRAEEVAGGSCRVSKVSQRRVKVAQMKDSVCSLQEGR